MTPITASLPMVRADIAAAVAEHPCYSVNAHHRYARMHVPVAPGCNIQCGYCNRKFDCANESRPGVTSALLTPEQAVDKVTQVANTIPSLRVVGIAGPGEPLANVSRTFRTLELIRQKFPDMHLCLSTNGLTLSDHIQRIVDLGIKHVTITINAIDPDIAAHIYLWITYRGRRYTGVEAANILIDRQLAGLQMLIEHGLICKINSVMIPGINDNHLVEVSQTVRKAGAFIHNILPLISDQSHGTYFGAIGQREPTPQELAALRDQCATPALPTGSSTSLPNIEVTPPRRPEMTIMRHCRQCRADAIGLLGQDRQTEFTNPEAPERDESSRVKGCRLSARH